MEANELTRPRTSVAAISSLVCGLLGCIPFLPGLTAVILGIVGIRKIKDPMVTGRGMAIAGLVLGCLSLAAYSIVTAAGLVFYFKTAEPARATAEQFTRNVSEGKVDAAAATSVEGMDRASLVALSERMKPWGAFQSLGLNSLSIQETNGKVEFKIGGIATFATETKSYTLTLHREGETYKVAKFDFP